TSYFTRGDDRGPTSHIVTPLGGSLEAGWRQNVFGGPCLAAHPSAFPLVESSIVNGRFAFWPAYAAIACAGLSLAVVPAPLYAVAAEVGDDDRHADIEAVLQRYHSWTPAGLDLGWVLKSAFSGQAVSPDDGVDGPAGRALYDRLVALPDQLIRAYAGLDEESSPDSLLRDFATVRQRVSAVLARWHETEPRVFVYGAGVHSKMLFAVCPDLGRLVAGFIDRRPMQRFLGKPCVTPEGFGPEMADAIVYSSREHECEMHARMKSAPVEHVLLYHESPPAPEASTTRRLRNRFGHQGADLDALASMYVVPTWATGFVSGSDAAFLVEMIAAQQPRTVVELGVASGASSAAILHGLDRLPDIDGGRVLHSCDVRSTCYFDEAYETGQACREMYPSPRATWRREFAMDAPRLVTTLPEASVDLTFIDANHSHPWPLLDLLHLSAVARPGSWVVLHDIDLPLHHPEYQVYGPRWLFRAWRHNKVKGLGPWTSIGALQLPARRSELVPMALALLKRPWEQAPSLQAIELPSAFAEIQAALEARLGTAQPSLV
ncbi:MAG: class I SAM-dependent methyltransferase, partial [Acidobacteriota bacterium]|nr:class I SAM-dependent methyltransferase [Acidobacteriota bacterium]